MKTLVTGGGGFIGSHLVERLKQRGTHVRCIVRNQSKAVFLESINVEIVLGDLNAKSFDWTRALQEVQEVYHVAGVTRARTSQEYYDGNYAATRKLIEACSELCPSLKRFIYISSLAAVGPSPDVHPLREDCGYHPVSDYGKSKMLGERAVLAYRDRVPVTILRPSAVYGPRERDMFEIIKLVRRGIQPLIGWDRKLLNLIHAEDLVDGIVSAGSSERAADEIYFLGSERNYTTEEIGQTIARVVHSHPLRIHVPHSIVYAIAAIMEVIGKLHDQPVFFNLEKAREITQSAWVCSIEKANSHFGFQPRLSLEEGLRMMHENQRENSCASQEVMVAK